MERQIISWLLLVWWIFENQVLTACGVQRRRRILSKNQFDAKSVVIETGNPGSMR